MSEVDRETMKMYQQRIRALQAETDLLYRQLRREQLRNRTLRNWIGELEDRIASTRSHP